MCVWWVGWLEVRRRVQKCVVSHYYVMVGVKMLYCRNQKHAIDDLHYYIAVYVNCWTPLDLIVILELISQKLRLVTKFQLLLHFHSRCSKLL